MREATVKILPSPNYSSRRGAPVDCIVIHHTNSMSLEKTLKLFTSQDNKVSAHYIIPRHAEEGIVNLVPVSQKAWHCGRASVWKAQDVNMFSVGIQLVGTADSGYTDFQYDACAQICAEIMHVQPKVLFNRIIGHDAIAERGNGPGTLWQWTRFFDRLVTRLYGLNIERD